MQPGGDQTQPGYAIQGQIPIMPGAIGAKSMPMPALGGDNYMSMG